jgi:hypothetical protein
LLLLLLLRIVLTANRSASWTGTGNVNIHPIAVAITITFSTISFSFFLSFPVILRLFVSFTSSSMTRTWTRSLKLPPRSRATPANPPKARAHHPTSLRLGPRIERRLPLLIVLIILFLPGTLQLVTLFFPRIPTIPIPCMTPAHHNHPPPSGSQSLSCTTTATCRSCCCCCGSGCYRGSGGCGCGSSSGGGGATGLKLCMSGLQCVQWVVVVVLALLLLLLGALGRGAVFVVGYVLCRDGQDG